MSVHWMTCNIKKNCYYSRPEWGENWIYNEVGLHSFTHIILTFFQCVERSRLPIFITTHVLLLQWFNGKQQQLFSVSRIELWSPPFTLPLSTQTLTYTQKLTWRKRYTIHILWYWVPQKLPQISTVIAYTCIRKVAWFANLTFGLNPWAKRRLIP